MPAFRVYIASPYTLGNREMNVKKSLYVSDLLIRNGMAPYAPLLNHYQHVHFPQDYDVWLALDIVWMEQCHAVIRLPGESLGADVETAHARRLGIPVFEDVFDLLTEFRARLQAHQAQRPALPAQP